MLKFSFTLISSLKNILIKLELYPVDENPIGRVPWRSLKLKEHFFKAQSFAQQGEDLNLDRILSRKLNLNLSSYKGFYVDAGAYHPISHSTSYLLYKRGWDGVCVDISSHTCNLFRKYRPKDTMIHAATSDFDGELFFNDKGSVSLSNRATQSQISGNKIPAKKLDTILGELNINREIDYLNIDTEGAEIQTMKGLDFGKYKPKVVSVEIHSDSIESALRTDIAIYLYERGYKCVACNVITFFFIKKTL